MAKPNTARQREFRERKRNNENFKENEKKIKKAKRLRKKETQSKQEAERVRELARERLLLKRSQVPPCQFEHSSDFKAFKLQEDVNNN